MNNESLTAADVAEILSIGRNAVYELASTGANTGVASAVVGLLGIAGVGRVVARRRAR